MSKDFAMVREHSRIAPHFGDVTKDWWLRGFSIGFAWSPHLIASTLWLWLVSWRCLVVKSLKEHSKSLPNQVKGTCPPLTRHIFYCKTAVKWNQKESHEQYWGTSWSTSSASTKRSKSPGTIISIIIAWSCQGDLIINWNKISENTCQDPEIWYTSLGNNLWLERDQYCKMKRYPVQTRLVVPMDTTTGYKFLSGSSKYSSEAVEFLEGETLPIDPCWNFIRLTPILHWTSKVHCRWTCGIVSTKIRSQIRNRITNLKTLKIKLFSKKLNWLFSLVPFWYRLEN